MERDSGTGSRLLALPSTPARRRRACAIRILFEILLRYVVITKQQSWFSLAEGEGFEPSIGFLLYSLSRTAH